MPLPITISDGATISAVLISLWAVRQTSRFNRRQNDFAETAERLNRLLIEKEAAESKAKHAAELGANFVKMGKNDYRLKVFNRGAGVARNVRLELLEGEDVIDERELAEKCPIPLLERHQTVELRAWIHLQSSRRARIRLFWDDDSAAGQTKDVWSDVF
ncbi:UNVERIFIED_ORG: hypothetical protein M2348_000033 [Sphingomonas sp. R1F5B]